MSIQLTSPNFVSRPLISLQRTAKVRFSRLGARASLCSFHGSTRSYPLDRERQADFGERSSEVRNRKSKVGRIAEFRPLISDVGSVERNKLNELKKPWKQVG